MSCRKGTAISHFLGGPLKEQTSLERLEGYRLALKDQGMPFNDKMIIQSDFSLEGGYQAFEAFMKTKRDVTAVVACNDLMGVGCLNYCQERGFAVPQDISIITLDNTDYCLCTHPRLTSINMMQNQIGELAAQIVMERIQNRDRL